jgi:hypothetical protein
LLAVAVVAVELLDVSAVAVEGLVECWFLLVSL